AVERRERQGAARWLDDARDATAGVALDGQPVAVPIALFDQQIHSGDAGSGEAPDLSVLETQTVRATALGGQYGAGELEICRLPERAVVLQHEVVARGSGQDDTTQRGVHFEKDDVDRQRPARPEFELESGDGTERVDRVVRAMDARGQPAG